MEQGAYYSHALSEKHIQSQRQNLAKYWLLLNEKPNLNGFTKDNFMRIWLHPSLQIDRLNKNDFFSQKYRLYQAVMSFTKFLVRNELMPDLARLELKSKEIIPKKVFKKQKKILAYDDIQLAFSLNRSWLNGRSQYDVMSTELFIALYFYAGLRLKEAMWLELDNIDLGENEMLIFGKHYKERYVTISPELKQLILVWLNEWRPKTKNKYFMVKRNGDAFSEWAIKSKFKRLQDVYKKRTGKRLHIHGLRNSFAKYRTASGQPLNQVKEEMGHTEISTTIIYATDTRDDRKRWVQQMLYQHDKPEGNAKTGNQIELKKTLEKLQALCLQD